MDIGVHQDGLKHISALTDRFIKDPREVVKAGDIVRVKVVEVDEARKRIALTMRLQDETATKSVPLQQSAKPAKIGKEAQRNKSAVTSNAFAEAFANAKRR